MLKAIILCVSLIISCTAGNLSQDHSPRHQIRGEWSLIYYMSGFNHMYKFGKETITVHFKDDNTCQVKVDTTLSEELQKTDIFFEDKTFSYKILSEDSIKIRRTEYEYRNKDSRLILMDQFYADGTKVELERINGSDQK